jgi:hypothetical protein
MVWKNLKCWRGSSGVARSISYARVYFETIITDSLSFIAIGKHGLTSVSINGVECGAIWLPDY